MSHTCSDHEQFTIVTWWLMYSCQHLKTLKTIVRRFQNVYIDSSETWCFYVVWQERHWIKWVTISFHNGLSCLHFTINLWDKVGTLTVFGVYLSTCIFFSAIRASSCCFWASLCFATNFSRFLAPMAWIGRQTVWWGLALMGKQARTATTSNVTLTDRTSFDDKRRKKLILAELMVH